MFFFILQLCIHVFLDAFNAYGTGWFEPFSHYRVSFNVLFVADPFYSVWLGISFLALLILISLCLISLNIILVTAQTWIIAYSGLIFLGFGAAEWTRDMSVGYYKTMLSFGIKLMVTLLLAGIGLDILHTVQAQAGQGWGTDLALLAKAMASSAILLGIIAKAPDAVASIAGVSTGGLGHGVGTFVTAAGMGLQAGAWAGGTAAQGGKQLGQAVRNAVKQGQALSRGRP